MNFIDYEGIMSGVQELTQNGCTPEQVNLMLGILQKLNSLMNQTLAREAQ